jgi:hypothetical protein
MKNIRTETQVVIQDDTGSTPRAASSYPMCLSPNRQRQLGCRLVG